MASKNEMNSADDKKEKEDELLSMVKSNCTNLGNGIFKLTALLNHQIDANFINSAVDRLHNKLMKNEKISNVQVDKIVTAPISGIIPSFSMCAKLGNNVKMIYVRHKIPITWSKKHSIYESEYISHTKQTKSKIYISAEYIGKNDKVLIIDDVLASGKTVCALIDVCIQANAQIIGAGFVVEKKFEKGREKIQSFCAENKIKTFPIESAVIIKNMEQVIGGNIEYDE